MHVLETLLCEVLAVGVVKGASKRDGDGEGRDAYMCGENGRSPQVSPFIGDGNKHVVVVTCWRAEMVMLSRAERCECI